ncbi:MAG: glycosyltransferase [Polyangiaceae bacterium]|nr:glycosyltransferase [Polyangiaceae bacterium]
MKPPNDIVEPTADDAEPGSDSGLDRSCDRINDTTEIESLRQENQSALGASLRSERYQALSQLEAQLASLRGELECARQETKAERARLEAQLVRLREHAHAELARAREQSEAELERERIQSQATLDRAKAKHAAELKALAARQTAKLAELEQAYRAAMRDSDRRAHIEAERREAAHARERDELKQRGQHPQEGLATSETSGIESRHAHEAATKELEARLQVAATVGAALIAEWGAANHRMLEAEDARDALKGHLSYRLGWVLVSRLRSFTGWLSLPFLLWKAWRGYVRDQREAPAGSPAGAIAITEDTRFPLKLLARRPPAWLEIAARGSPRLLLSGTLQSFAPTNEEGVLLLVRGLGPDAQGRAGIDSQLRRSAFGHDVYCLCLRTGLNEHFSLDLRLPDETSVVSFAFVCHHAPMPIRLVLHEAHCRAVDSGVRPALGSTRSKEDAAAETPCFSPGPDPRPRLRAASLLDEFSEACWAYEMDLVPLDRKQWREQLEREGVSLFFAESAWHGNSGTWNDCMSKFDSHHGDDLRAVLEFCRARSIPTVFWNQEDPVHFEVFLPVARQFDYVFTTDADCLPRYRELLGHPRVDVLPFAAQWRMHNPVEHGDRNGRVAFTGSWSAREYPARARWLQMAMAPLASRGVLDIYDRHAEADDLELRFPAHLQDCVRGCPPYPELVSRVYKRYAALLNVNSVEDSSTMVARRVFEIVACGTPVISSPSPALDRHFSDIVLSVSSPEQLDQALSLLNPKDLDTLARRVRGVRAVHSAHTYSHRARHLQQRLDLADGDDLQPEVTLVCVSKRPRFLEHVAAQLQAQSYTNVHVTFVCHGPGFDEAEVRRALAFTDRLQVLQIDADQRLADGLNLAVRHAKTRYLAKIDDDDYYGENYLLDSMLAVRYSEAALVGKASYFVYLQGSDRMALRFPGRHYRFSERVAGATFVWDLHQIRGIEFERVRQGTDSAFVAAVKSAGLPIFAADPFNFLHIRHAEGSEHTWKATDKEILRKASVVGRGVDLKRVNI